MDANTDSIYQCQGYREALVFLVAREKRRGQKISYGEVADEIRVQRSYFSKVINNYAELSRDQIYLVSQFFELPVKEEEFLLLLHDFDRTSIAKRKGQLKSEIQEICKIHHRPVNHVPNDLPDFSTTLDEYFLDPYAQLVHEALEIRKFSEAPEALAGHLQISSERLTSLLKFLEDNGFIRFENGNAIPLKQNWHIPTENPLFLPWYIQQRTLSSQKITALKKDESYCFNVIFSAEDNTIDEIRAEFLKFVRRLKKVTETAKKERVFQIGFETVPWTK